MNPISAMTKSLVKKVTNLNPGHSAGLERSATPPQSNATDCANAETCENLEESMKRVIHIDRKSEYLSTNSLVPVFVEGFRLL